MSVKFDSYDDRLAASTVPSNGDISASCWIRLNADNNSNGAVWVMEAPNEQFYGLCLASDGTTLQQWDNTGDAGGSGPTLSLDTWYWVGTQHANGGPVKMYVAEAGSSAITTYSGHIWNSFAATPDILLISGVESILWSGNRYFPGDIANFKFWSAQLTLAELAQERWSFNPHRMSNLVGWWPLQDTTTKGVDRKGGGNTLTNPGGSGAWSTSDTPPYARRSLWRVLQPEPEASGPIGELAVTLATSTLSAAGTPLDVGTLAVTLATPTVAASGTPVIVGDVAMAVPVAALAAEGSPIASSSLAVTLATPALAAVGEVPVAGAVAVGLQTPALSAAGTPINVGALAVTLATPSVFAYSRKIATTAVYAGTTYAATPVISQIKVVISNG